MKTRKIIKSIIIVLILISGCASAPGPSAVVENYLKDKKAEAVKSFEESVGSDDSLFGGSEELEKKFYSMIADYDHKIISEETGEDGASVEVEISTYDFGNMFISFFQDYLAQALSLSMSGAGDEEIETLAAGIMEKHLDELKEEGKQYNGQVIFQLNKIDGKWTIDEDASADAFAEALTGGLTRVLESLSSMSFD